MTPVTSQNWIRVLLGPPLGVVLFLATCGASSQRVIADGIGKDVKTTRLALDALCHEFFVGARPVCERVGYRAWALSAGAYQLPLPGLPDGVDKLPEVGVSPSSARAPAVDKLSEVGISPTSTLSEVGISPTSEQKLSIQSRLMIDGCKVLDGLAISFLDSLGVVNSRAVGGRWRLSEVVAAWWFVSSQDWVRDPRAMLYTHLRLCRETPGAWLELAVWFLGSSVAEHEQARDAVGGYAEWPIDFPVSARRVARWWVKVGLNRAACE